MEGARPSFREAVRFWLKLGFVSFGGPAGQIAIMHAELVEKRRWISEERFLHALNFCMLLPGPEATQLATYCGWLLHRTWGGIVAGALFVLPGAVVLWAAAWVYSEHGDVAWIAAVFDGLKPAVTAIVAAAVIRIGRRALKGPAMWALAAAAFGAIFFLRVPFPAIVAGAAAIGLVGARWGAFSPAAEARAGGTDEAKEPVARFAIDEAGAGEEAVRPTWGRAAKVLVVSLVFWWAPVWGAGVWQGWDGVLVKEAVFFSKAAMVTFGGAYAVLPYVAQEAVERHAWLTAPQMLDGLGLAETTPGPLIMVVQFVGFLGGWNQAGEQSPLLMGTLGAAITTWTTFVPCFLWIFLGAPHIEQLRGNRRLNGALTAVTASVVGVVLNLAVWFGWQVLYREGRVDWFAATVCGGAFVALQRFGVGLVTVLVASGVAGVLRWAWVGAG